MKTKHTPGPWKAVRNHPDPQTALSMVEIVPESGDIEGYPTSLPIASLFNAEAGSVQSANATLIAAAPDLLAALEIALPRIACRLAPEDLQARRIVERAIMLAKGEL